MTERNRGAARLTEKEIAILEILVKNGPLEPPEVPSGERESLLVNGYVRLVGGVLVTTHAGIVALADQRKKR